jgi:hypothetical protein
VGFFDGLQRWSRRRKALGLLESGDVKGTLALIGRDEVLRQELAHQLLDDGKLELSRALLGHGASTFDTLLTATPADPELDRLKAAALTKHLLSDTRALEVARGLEVRGEKKLAMDLLERQASAAQSWAPVQAALEALIDAEAWKRAWPLVETGFSMKRQLQPEEREFLLRAHQRVLGALRGAEFVTVDLLMRGELDPFSGRNHLLLARALMKDSPPLAQRLRLTSAPKELRDGEELLRAERKSAAGLMLVGSAKYRMGEVLEGAEAFEQGRAVAPRHFGLVAGLGAAKRADQERALARVRALPDLAPIPGLERVLPDVDHLTPLELRVAQASVRPLARWLPELPGQLRVLPLDVRVTDLPEFEALRGEVEARDHRAWDALGGLAGDGLACVRVEELFFLGELEWTLAHELAHLVHRVLPGSLAERITAAWQRAKQHEYAFDQYQLSNEHEFFAVTYTRWLARKYGLPRELEADPDGHLERAFAVIDAVVA